MEGKSMENTYVLEAKEEERQAYKSRLSINYYSLDFIHQKLKKFLKA